MEILGIRLVGLTEHTLHKLVLSIIFIAGVALVRFVLVAVVRLARGGQRNERVVFWTRQGVNLLTAALVVLAILSIWFDDPKRLAEALGIIAAGLAFAMQRVVTALAGYAVILRGRTFSVGDRITMGGVRGDVISLGFLQTRIMEMGEPVSATSDSPTSWVHARQFTGRIVTVTNDKLFDNPVFNYTRDFPYLWEEIHIPVPYGSSRKRAEQILLEAARRHTHDIHAMSEEERARLHDKYMLRFDEMLPKVYYRLTDNWIEMTVRFVVPTHGVRPIKDAMSREILDGFDEAGIQIASGTYDVVGVPPLKIELTSATNTRRASDDESREEERPH